VKGEAEDDWSGDEKARRRSSAWAKGLGFKRERPYIAAMSNRLSTHIRAATLYESLNQLRHLGRVASILTCYCVFATSAAIAEERQAPANYKELIQSAVKTSFIDPATVGLVEISPLHPTRGPQLGDWMACLRIAINGQPTLYSAFIDGEPPKVILLRLAVRFDDCAQDQYDPLPSVPPVQDRPAGPPRKK
jgi:hypothetical protein